MVNKQLSLILASVLMLVLISGLAMSSDQDAGNGGAVKQLVLGTTDEVKNLNVDDGVFNTYREAFLTKSLVRVDASGKYVPALAESWETEDASKWSSIWRRT
jgi:ABC-type transport system substrate-binding protein